jgi:hypothetical protein
LDACGFGFPNGFLQVQRNSVKKEGRAGEYVIPGDETDHAGSQQQATKPAKNPADDLAQYTFRRRRDLVSTILRGAALCLRGIEACLWRDGQPAERLIDGYTVPIEL